MAITETQRTLLYNELAEAIGQEAASTLMEQLPPSGWDQVATKDDVKACEERLHHRIEAGEKLLQGELKETEGRVMLEIIASESRQSAHIAETNTRIDEANTRINETNAHLTELKGEVSTGFAGLHLALARQARWMALALVGFTLSVWVPLAIALL